MLKATSLHFSSGFVARRVTSGCDYPISGRKPTYRSLTLFLARKGSRRNPVNA
jgi:hypothetical protein